MKIDKRQPCKDCGRRYIGCHDRCEDYKTFKQLTKKVEIPGDREYNEYIKSGRTKRARRAGHNVLQKRGAAE